MVRSQSINGYLYYDPHNLFNIDFELSPFISQKHSIIVTVVPFPHNPPQNVKRKDEMGSCNCFH